MFKRNETNKDKIKRRADLLYPSMDNNKENSRVEALNSIAKKDGQEKPNNKPKTRKTSDKILDLFFPSMKNETQKDINKNKKVISNNKEYEIINNVKYPKKTDSKEVELLKEKAKKEIKEIEKERRKEYAKNFGGATLEIGSAAIPVGGEIKAASSIVKALTPKLGRKVSEAIVKQGTKGTLTGSVFGMGESLMEDKNPIKTVGKDAAIGAISGISSGSITGKFSKNIAQQKIQNSEIKNRIKLSNEYYKDYERGVKITRKDLGKIILNSDAFKETTKQNPKDADKVINLSKNLKEAKYIGTEKPQHSHKYDIVQFHRLSGKDSDYLIAENSKGKYYFYKVVDKKK